MIIKDLGDKVEITETVAEINQRAIDAGCQPPFVIVRMPILDFDVRKKVFEKMFTHGRYRAAYKEMTKEEFKEMYSSDTFSVAPNSQ